MVGASMNVSTYLKYVHNAISVNLQGPVSAIGNNLTLRSFFSNTAKISPSLSTSHARIIIGVPIILARLVESINNHDHQGRAEEVR